MPRVASAVVFFFSFFLFLLFLFLLVAARGVAREARAIVTFVFFLNAPARVTNIREPAGFVVILKGLSPLT